MGWQDAPLADSAPTPSKWESAPLAGDRWSSAPEAPEAQQHQWGGFKEVVEAAQPLYEQGVDAIRRAAASPWRMVQNISEQVFPLPAAVTNYAKQAAEQLETPMYGPAQTLPEKIVGGGVEGAAKIPQYAVAAATGGPVALAAMGAAEELHKGPYAAARAAGNNAVLGLVAGPLSEFTRPSQAAVYGTVAAIQTAAEGGSLQDIVASAVSASGLATAGPAGKRSVLPEGVPLVDRDLANPATELRRLRYGEGVIPPEGEQRATSEGIKPEGNVTEHPNRDQGGQATEAGGGNRLQRGGQEPPTAEQGRTERPVESPELQTLRDYERRVQTDVEGLTGEEKYQALRDTATKIAQIEAQQQRNPLGAQQGGAFSLEPLEPVARAVTSAINATKPLIAEGVMKVSPMEMGSLEAAGAAHDIANLKRAIDLDMNAAVRVLDEGFTPAEHQLMWNRLSEEAVARQQGRSTAGTGTGFDGLTVRQKEAILELQDRSSRVAQQAVDLGMLKDPMAIYDPRVFAEMLPNGVQKALVGGAGGGPALSTMRGGARISTPNLKARKHVTAEESEAAAKAKLGEQVQLVRDIRVLPIVTAQLEHAIAGKRLINQVREYGKAAGDRTDAPFSYEGGSRYFTLPENPSFYEYRYVGKDELGNPQVERRPIYVHRDFEGPLRAVLESREPGKIYSGLMGLKNANSALVMLSPLVHHSTIFFKALPFMPGKVMTLQAYVEGSRLRSDPAFARQSVQDGVVYVNSHQFQQEVQNQLPEGLLRMQPGRGITSKLARTVSPTLARGIDKFGAFWHQTLLWDRIADLQASIYHTVRADLQTKGLDARTAGQTAAHFANRFGGAIPREELSAGATKLANLALFSKSFTGTNLGLYLDAVRGLPKSTQGSIRNAAGDVARQTANSYVRRQASATILKDIGLLIGLNALVQSGLEKLRDDKEWGAIYQGYADRFSRLWNNVKENPLHVLNTPFESLNSLAPQGENEPGKTTRVKLATEKSGQVVYGKISGGKTAEDLIHFAGGDWGSMLHNKLSGLAQFASQVYGNQDAFGRRIWDPEGKGFSGTFAALGNIGKAFMKAQVPTDMLEALYNAQLKGLAGTRTDERQFTTLKGPLAVAGVSVSRGSAKGPAGGVVSEAMRQHEFSVQQGTKIGLDLLDQGKTEDAMKAMVEAGMTPQEAGIMLRYRNQYGVGTMRKFFQTATPEQLQDFYRLQR